MRQVDLIRSLARPAETRIVFLILDGLGGAPAAAGAPTALEAARTPELDRLAAEGICGLHVPVRRGITSGSGPAHLALFGYDPLEFVVGRGVLAALGVDFDLRPADVAARGNFCTVGENGLVLDRRAGRLHTERNNELCNLLQRKIGLPGVELFVRTVEEHRFLLVLRGEGLSGEVSDTDPFAAGRPPSEPRALSPQADRTADLVRSFLRQAGELLRGEGPANMVLLRGFARRPDWPGVEELYGLRAAAAAGYPMYRGIARLLGMRVLDTAEIIDEKLAAVRRAWDGADLLFVHVKGADEAGEDGDFARKVAVIERVDAALPHLRALGPDVLVVTGDHSTPASLRSHSWHPVPALLWSRVCRPDGVRFFHEAACLAGGLGPAFPATDLMPLALANAGRLARFGA